MVINVFNNTPQHFIDDVVCAREYLHGIRDQVSVVRNIVEQLNTLNRDLDERDKKIEQLRNKSITIISTINLWKYNLNDLQEKLNKISSLDFKNKRLLKKQITETKECLNDLYDSQAKTSEELLENTRRKLFQTEEIKLNDTQKELYGAVKKLASDISEYRQFRALFKQEYNEILPEVNLTDFVNVTGKGVKVEDTPMPFVSMMYYDNIYFKTEEHIDGEVYSAEEV